MNNVNDLTREEIYLLKGSRQLRRPIARETAGHIISALLYGMTEPLFQGTQPEDNPDSYLGEHAIRRTFDLLESRSYIEQDERDPSLVRPSNTIPIGAFG